MKIPFLKTTEETPGTSGDRWSLFRGGDPIFNEQFKAASAKFEYRANALGSKVVAVTSSIAGEGKSVSAANLATHLASTGRKKVLLVDVDLRKCDLTRGMGINPTPGLSEYLGGSATLQQILQKSESPGLFLIPGGKRIPEPWGLINGEPFRKLLENARAHVDIVLIDTPPIVPVSDTLSLRDFVDAFLLVYRLGFTPYPILRQAVDEVGKKKLFGVLLNGARRKSEEYYRQYYGDYYKKPETP